MADTDHHSREPSGPIRRYPKAAPFIARSLREAFNLMTTELDDALAPLHQASTPATNRLMVFIDPDGTSMAELARRCQMTRQSMLEHVARLETHGYVVRRPHPVDRRMQLVTLTSQGRAAIADGYAIVQAQHRRWSALIGEDEMAALITLLDRLIGAVRLARSTTADPDDRATGVDTA